MPSAWVGMEGWVRLSFGGSSRGGGGEEEEV